MFNWQAVSEGAGLTLMTVGMVVVFCALVILLFMMKALKILTIWRHHKKMARQREPEYNEVSAGVIAAIAITLMLEDDQIHDNESLVLTLHSLSKPYSNWWMRDLEKSWRTWRHREGKKLSKHDTYRRTS